MSSLMNAYATIAQTYGNVDPSDEAAVQRFFEETLPTFSPTKQQEIVDELFFKTTGLGPDFPQEQNQDHDQKPEEISTLENDHLSSVETQILRFIVNGHSNSRIARELEISRVSLLEHIANIWKKMSPSAKDVFLSSPERNLFLQETQYPSGEWQQLLNHYLQYVHTPHNSTETFLQWIERTTERAHRS